MLSSNDQKKSDENGKTTSGESSLEMDLKLTSDKGGLYRDELLDRLSQYEVQLKGDGKSFFSDSDQNNGLKRDEFLKAIELSKALLCEVWSSKHEPDSDAS